MPVDGDEAVGRDGEEVDSRLEVVITEEGGEPINDLEENKEP